MLCSYYWLKQWLQRKDHELDLEQITPSDYTVIVKGLGSEFDVKELEEYFSNYGREDRENVEIVKSNVAYDIGEFTELCRRKGDLETKKMVIDECKAHGEDPPPSLVCFCIKKKDETDVEELNKEISINEEMIKKYMEDRPSGTGADL
jgi:hypothetical protein